MNYLSYQPCGHTFQDDGNMPESCPVCGIAKAKKRNHKYNAKPVRDDEHGYFHSTGEWKRHNDLLLLQKSGAIWALKRQKTFRLNTIQQSVVWDFYYMELVDGAEREIVEDYKGAITAEFRRKKKAFQLEYPAIIFRETKAPTKATRHRVRQAFGRKKAAR